MRPTKEGIHETVESYIRLDEAGCYIPYEQAERMLDTLFEVYTDIRCQYITHSTGIEELIISTVVGKVVLFRIRIRR